MSDRVLRKQLALLAKGPRTSDSKDQNKARTERQRVKRQRVRPDTDTELTTGQVQERNLAFFRDTMAQPASKK